MTYPWCHFTENNNHNPLWTLFTFLSDKMNVEKFKERRKENSPTRRH